MIDVKELQILNTTKCECGHEYSLKDFTNLEMLEDSHGFYGNLVKHYCRTFCPECSQNKILLLKQKGQTWEIINTAVQKRDLKNVIPEQTTIENKTENVQEQEFICPVCQKVCKSKIGLASHIKTHQNQI